MLDFTLFLAAVTIAALAILAGPLLFISQCAAPPGAHAGQECSNVQFEIGPLPPQHASSESASTWANTPLGNASRFCNPRSSGVGRD